MAARLQAVETAWFLESLADGLTERFSTRPSKVDVAAQLAETEQLTKAYNRSKLLRRIAWYAGEAKFVPASDKIEWKLRPLVQPADLAELLEAQPTRVFSE